MKKKNKSGKATNPMLVKGILTSAIVAVCLTLLFGAFALYGVISMWGARAILFIAWSIAVGGILLSDVIWDKSRRFKIFSTLVAAIVFGLAAWSIDTWAVKTKERHLTRDQWIGLAQIRNGLPKKCGMLVYIPIESAEAQNYGKEIQAALQSRGDKANLVFAGAMEPQVGLLVGILSELTPCGQAGEIVASQMTSLQMPARIQEGFPNDSDTVIIILVGTKPPYD
jgi:hypothetical protein